MSMTGEKAINDDEKIDRGALEDMSMQMKEKDAYFGKEFKFKEHP